MAIDGRIVYRGPPRPGVIVADDLGRRSLYLDGDTLQSRMILDDPVRLCMGYSQAMMCALFFQPAPRQVLLVGLGGGSLVKFLLEFCPEAAVEVVEIDPEIVAVAHRFFSLPDKDPRLRITVASGEEVVAARLAADERYDLLLLDAFDDNGPARALLEGEFLRRCRGLLSPAGVFAMNLWNRPVDNFPAIHAGIASVFGDRTLKLLLAESYGNAIVFGFLQTLRVQALPQLKGAAGSLGRRTGINFIRFLRQLHWQNS
ncbi:MAG: fused MFS/spermidine synthase [Thermodesulfobacteriota bacterium]